MAKNIKLSSGSIFCGNPITISLEPMTVVSKDTEGNTIYPSFHRIIVEVNCGLNNKGEGTLETIKMSQPVEEEKDGTTIIIDISSALRTLRDSYEYSPQVTTYPFVAYNVKAYDEYMLNGELKTEMGVLFYPAEKQYLRALFGGFSDLIRLSSSAGTHAVRELSTKPTTPHLAAVGDTFAYTPAYTVDQDLLGSGSLVPPTSQEVQLDKAGLQTIGGQQLYVLPKREVTRRTVFRFINSRGVLESISVPQAYSKKLSVTTNNYTVSRQETFNSFSRAATSKKNDQESWLFVSDPLNEQWLDWYLHEFLMSEHIWIYCNGVYIPCIITNEDEVTMLDKTGTNVLSVSFTVKLDINGSLRL